MAAHCYCLRLLCLLCNSLYTTSTPYDAACYSLFPCSTCATASSPSICTASCPPAPLAALCAVVPILAHVVQKGTSADRVLFPHFFQQVFIKISYFLISLAHVDCYRLITCHNPHHYCLTDLLLRLRWRPSWDVMPATASSPRHLLLPCHLVTCYCLVTSSPATASSPHHLLLSCHLITCYCRISSSPPHLLLPALASGGHPGS